MCGARSATSNTPGRPAGAWPTDDRRDVANPLANTIAAPSVRPNTLAGCRTAVASTTPARAAAMLLVLKVPTRAVMT